ncbi:MAG: Ribosome-releasing factor 2, mitochondrial [Bogoriella megaspora]|nr:MAG: Ribosome-releasing factor 2, mitochondrial [Bogoriella megaspora]
MSFNYNVHRTKPGCIKNTKHRNNSTHRCDVDEGSTVTDFLPAERARGITIQSAAITFHWPPVDNANALESQDPGTPKSSFQHTINLIDTPGHADFTFEVLRSLRILDGAVCVLDGVAGVEAQTEHVWEQANTYSIPRIVFVNKLDREGATFAKTIREIGGRLHGWPAVCQFPWFEDGRGRLQGVADVVGLRGLLWAEGSDGKSIKSFSLAELEDRDTGFAQEIRKARVALVELLSEHDEQMIEQFIENNEDHLAISAAEIIQSLRRCVLKRPQQVVPVYAGASFRNIGVQPLLDAVVDLLPSPEECPDPEISVASTKSGLYELLSGKAPIPEHAATVPGRSKKLAASNVAGSLNNMQACALAFKVVNDARRGVLVYVRVYSGSISRNSLLFNTNLGNSERVQRILRMYASEAVEIDSIEAGQIGVIPGLKFARTGDTLLSFNGLNQKQSPPAPLNALQLRPIDVPPPVFFTSVEPNSLAEEKPIADALALLLREDPSLNVSVDPESGQTHLAGMGELHLEIARDRLVNDLKAKATTGAVEIGYREKILGASSGFRATYDKDVAGKPSRASCTATVLSVPHHSTSTTDTVYLADSNILEIQFTAPSSEGVPAGREQILAPTALSASAIYSAIETGASTALVRGPKYHYPMHSTRLKVTLEPLIDLVENTTPTAISAATRIAVKNALKAAASKAEAQLMEPVMLVKITLDEASLGGVVHDLSAARGGHVLSLDSDDTIASIDEGVNSSGSGVLPVINVAQIYAPPDPFASSSTSDPGSDPSRRRQITAKVPLKEMVGYLKHLRSLTGGRGTFVMKVDTFESMSAQRQKAMLDEMRGDYA